MKKNYNIKKQNKSFGYILNNPNLFKQNYLKVKDSNKNQPIMIIQKKKHRDKIKKKIKKPGPLVKKTIAYVPTVTAAPATVTAAPATVIAAAPAVIISKQKDPIKLNNDLSAAIIIGIEYQDRNVNKEIDILSNCHNNAFDMQDLLITKYNLKSSNIQLLIDKQGYMLPTKENILHVLKNVLTQTTFKNIFFIYSGHGSNISSSNKKDDSCNFISCDNERINEQIVPCDSFKHGFILDETLRNYLLTYLNVNNNFIGIFDSYHRSSVLNLPKIYYANSNIMENDLINFYKEKQGQIICLTSYCDDDNSDSDFCSTFSCVNEKIKWKGFLIDSLKKIINENKELNQLSVSKLLNQLQSQFDQKGFQQRIALSINNINNLNINEIMFPYF